MLFRSNVCIWRLRFWIRRQSRTVLFICLWGSKYYSSTGLCTMKIFWLSFCFQNFRDDVLMMIVVLYLRRSLQWQPKLPPGSGSRLPSPTWLEFLLNKCQALIMMELKYTFQVKKSNFMWGRWLYDHFSIIFHSYQKVKTAKLERRNCSSFAKVL